MKITKGEIAVFAIALAAFLVGACFYPYLPERMASHWNAKGEVDGYMSKEWGTFLMPIVILGLGLLLMVIVRIDPLKANIAKFRKYYDGFIILFSVFLFCLNLWMLLWNVGYEFSLISLNIVMPIGLGLLIFCSGILCEYVKRNWFIGIRTPWTLSSDIVWARTHKIGAKLFKAVGIVILAGAFWPAYLLWFILIPIILVTVFLFVYSYVVYQKIGEIDASAGSLNDASGNGTWDSVKAGYLDQVEKALALAGHREKKQVLEDVRSHLDQRFNELASDEQTWENMQAIITEMGPADDYAELLAPETIVRSRSIGLRHFWWIGVITIVIASAILAPRIMAPKVGYIVSFRLTRLYQNITARELQDKFNRVCPPSVRAHHYRTQIQGNNLVGFIVVDTEEDKASLYNALLESKELMSWSVRSVTQKEFERHCALGQPSLRTDGLKKDYIPETSTIDENGRIVDKTDFPFVDDPQVIGKWTSVDLVDSINDFDPGIKRWPGDLFLHELDFHENGRLIAKNDKVKRGYALTWTSGVIISSHKKTASKYHIKEIDGEKYLFYEWKSGDYTVRHRKPSYYVLKKEPVEIDIAVVDFKVRGCYDDQLRAKGFYDVTASIRNKGEQQTGQFGVYFYRGDPATSKPRTHAAGPIKSGGTWNEYTGPFELKEGTNVFSVVIDPGNKISDPDRSNNTKTIKVIVKNGQVIEKAKLKSISPQVKTQDKDEQTTENAVKSAQAWLKLIDSGNYGKSWEEAADIFKNAATKQQWAGMAKTVCQPLGKVISRQVMTKMPTQTVPGGPDGEYVVIQFKTSFENKADAIETVTPMLYKDGIWRVSGYYIK